MSQHTQGHLRRQIQPFRQWRVPTPQQEQVTKWQIQWTINGQLPTICTTTAGCNFFSDLSTRDHVVGPRPICLTGPFSLTGSKWPSRPDRGQSHRQNSNNFPWMTRLRCSSTRVLTLRMITTPDPSREVFPLVDFPFLFCQRLGSFIRCSDDIQPEGGPAPHHTAKRQ